MRVPQRIAAALLAGAMSLSLAVAASAAKPANGQRAQAGVAVSPAMLSKLDLSADQQAKLKDASAAFQAEQKKAQDLSTPKEKRQALMAARQTYQTAIKSTLTPEQQTKLEAMMVEAKDYRALGPMGNNLVGMNLSSEQKEKIKAIGAKYEPDLAKLRADQKNATDKAAVRSQVQDVQKKMTDEVMAVLTPEQQSQMPKAKGAKKKKNNQ